MTELADAGEWSRNELMREFTVRALLELNATGLQTEGDRTELDNFIAATMLNLVPNETPVGFRKAVEFNNDFYVKHLIPIIDRLISSEVQALTEAETVDGGSVAQKYAELETELKALAENHSSLRDKIAECGKLLQEVLSDRRWAIEQQLAQASVDYYDIVSTIYDKKLINVNRNVHELFCSYRVDEAVEKVAEDTAKEIEALRAEIARRKKKHEIYLKARKISPEIDDLLESFQTTRRALKDLQMLIEEDPSFVDDSEKKD